jgi:hypothetical protein
MRTLSARTTDHTVDSVEFERVMPTIHRWSVELFRRFSRELPDDGRAVAETIVPLLRLKSNTD